MRIIRIIRTIATAIAYAIAYTIVILIYAWLGYVAGLFIGELIR